MPKATISISNFSSGQLSGLMKGRFLTDQYKAGSSILSNVLVSHYGSVFNRPGSYFVRQTLDNKAARLIPFVFNREQSYALEFTDEKVRFYTKGGIVVDGASPYVVNSPYEEDDLFNVSYTQSADVMYLTNQTKGIYKLSRFGNTNWTMVKADIKGGPFLPINNTDITLNPSSTTGSITVVASSSFFVAGHVGALFKMHGGIFKITSVTNGTNAAATVETTLTASTATADWYEGAWSDYRGYPSCVTFHEQRIYYGGSVFKPQTVWASVIAEYDNFDEGEANDEDAFSYTIDSDEVNSIMWMASQSKLHIGTAGGVFSMTGGNEVDTTVVFNPETSESSAFVRPVKIGTRVFFAGGGLRNLREYVYNLDINAYRAYNASLLTDVIDGNIIQIARTEDPYTTVWCLLDNGKIATMTREIDQNITAWSSQSTQGKYTSICSIPRGNEDEIWVVVEREVGGETKRYVEYFKSINFGEQREAFFVDSGLTYSGSTASSVSGFSHLEGLDVAILASGAVNPSDEVTSGAISLSRGYNYITAGLGYTSTVETLDLEGGSAIGTSQNKNRRVLETTLRFFNSLGCLFGYDDNMVRVPFRNNSDPLGKAIPLFSGDKSVSFNQGYSKQYKIKIQQDQPLPFHLLAIISNIVTND